MVVRIVRDDSSSKTTDPVVTKGLLSMRQLPKVRLLVGSMSAASNDPVNSDTTALSCSCGSLVALSQAITLPLTLLADDRDIPI